MQEDFFPQYLSSPLQVLWFETDQIAITMICFVLASVFGGWAWSLVFAGPYVYTKAKRKYPQGFLKHMMYFSGIKMLPYYPGYFEQEFME